MTDDIIDADVIEPEPERTVAALAIIDHQPVGALVRPAADLEDIVAAFQAYQALRQRLLVPADFQNISGKQFAKKSGWRKLSVAFGVNLTIKERVYERNEQGRIIRAEIVATATAPNGRECDGLGACDLFERCCFDGCKKGGNHKHCPAGKGDPCDGAHHFSNPQHDLPATAETRAKNRAASDLFGMGEVSAEEMTQEEAGYWGGWESEDEMKAAHDPLPVLRSQDARAKERQWLEDHGTTSWATKADFAEFSAFVRELVLQDSERSEGAGVAGPDAAPPTGEPPPATIGENERKRIMALCTERGISTAVSDREQRLNQLGQLIGRVPLKSVNDITADEYPALIDALKNLDKVAKQPELAS